MTNRDSLKIVVSQVSLILFVMILFAGCTDNRKFKEQLDYAESLLADNPDGAIEVLDSIPSDQLNALDHSQFIYVKTRAYAKTKRQITWADEMHEAAKVYEMKAQPYDGVKAGDYYYFAGLSYARDGQKPQAVVEWLKAAEVFEKEQPVSRLYSTYESLFFCFSEPCMQQDCIDYTTKMVSVARSINDSTRLYKALAATLAWVADVWPLDSTANYLLEELRIAKQLNNTELMCSAYADLSFLYIRYDSIEKAGSYVDSVVTLNPPLRLYQTIGKVRMKQGRIAEAVDWFLKAYPRNGISGKVFTAQYLHEISKTEPGYEYLSTYADSVIYYNRKYDKEEISNDLVQAVAQYQAQRKSEEFHQMLKSIGVAVAALVTIFLLLYGWKTWRTKLRIEHLQKLLQEEKAKMLVNEESPDPAERLRQRRESLRLHCELFYTTETYRDLKLLRELRAGQMVNANKRDELIHLVLAAFYDPIRPMLEGDQFSHEDLFLCLMTYMKFRSREIAACLGVSDDAIRQRKRRLKPKLEGGEFDLFFVE